MNEIVQGLGLLMQAMTFLAALGAALSALAASMKTQSAWNKYYQAMVRYIRESKKDSGVVAEPQAPKNPGRGFRLLATICFIGVFLFGGMGFAASSFTAAKTYKQPVAQAEEQVAPPAAEQNTTPEGEQQDGNTTPQDLPDGQDAPDELLDNGCKSLLPELPAEATYTIAIPEPADASHEYPHMTKGNSFVYVLAKYRPECESAQVLVDSGTFSETVRLGMWTENGQFYEAIALVYDKGEGSVYPLDPRISFDACRFAQLIWEREKENQTLKTKNLELLLEGTSMPITCDG